MFWSGSLRRFADRCGRSARSAGNGCNFTVWRLFLGGGPVPSGTDRYGRNTGTGPRIRFRPRTRASSLRAGFYRVDYGRQSGKAEFPCTARIRIFPGRIRKNAWSIVSSVRLHPGQNGVVNVLKSVVRMKLLPALTASACERDPLNAARVPCGVSERMGRAVYSHICADLMKNAEIL